MCSAGAQAVNHVKIPFNKHTMWKKAIEKGTLDSCREAHEDLVRLSSFSPYLVWFLSNLQMLALPPLLYSCTVRLKTLKIRVLDVMGTCWRSRRPRTARLVIPFQKMTNHLSGGLDWLE